VDLTFSAEEDAFRHEARTWLEANVPKRALPSGDTRAGFAEHLAWERALYEARWAVVAWPRAYGGRDATLMQWLIFEEEYWRAGAPQRVTQNGVFLLAPSIFAFGTQAQKDRLLPEIAAAKRLWAQGWSEPNAGSDLAALRSKAERVPGGFRVYGQKTWTTRGAFCDAIFGPFRTDDTVPPHAGMTYLLVPLQAEGVSVRGHARLDGDEGFADVFMDGVFVPDEDVLGGVGNGWKVAMSTTSSERALSLRSPGRFMASAARLRELCRQSPRGKDPVLRDRVVRACIDAEAYRFHTFALATRMQAGEALGPEASLSKIFWSELDIALHETALALLGPEAELDAELGEPNPQAGWMKHYQFSLAGPIYAGTNEIQRNVVAERVLGLPRK
jgi:alkylation response protein AidB-like acyl-CoA dehydrogenase